MPGDQERPEFSASHWFVCVCVLSSSAFTIKILNIFQHETQF